MAVRAFVDDCFNQPDVLIVLANKLSKFRFYTPSREAKESKCNGNDKRHLVSNKRYRVNNLSWGPDPLAVRTGPSNRRSDTRISDRCRKIRHPRGEAR